MYKYIVTDMLKTDTIIVTPLLVLSCKPLISSFLDFNMLKIDAITVTTFLVLCFKTFISGRAEEI